MTDGLVVVDKPAGWTSHDVVARCRKIFQQRRVGHSGTLDPDATGVLLVGLGKVTRLLRYLTELPKTYEGTLVLGVATSTLDASGEVVGEWDMSGVDLAQVEAAASRFVGEIEQVPPMVSAVKVGGRRLHELARAGIEVEREARTVTVHELSIQPGPAPRHFGMHVECSSGTYIRTLAADIGAALGGGAHLDSLRRTAIGSFTADAARPLDEVGPADVLAPAEALRDYRVVTVTEDVATAVGYGKPLDRHRVEGLEGEGPWGLVAGDGTLLAVYEAAGATVKPSVVLVP